MTVLRRKHNSDSHPGTTLRPVDWARDVETVRRLFQNYREWIAAHRDTNPAAESTVNAGLGQIDRQIAGLPGAYGPPHGDVLLAFAGDAVVACGSLGEIEPKVGEIKRIFVRADHRGPGFGPRMTGALLDRAEILGYERVRVDTLASMTAAIEFYQEMGFRPISAYWPHPAPGALFFEYRIRGPIQGLDHAPDQVRKDTIDGSALF
ncbi:MAG: GNAT family N-acetyltransferase [Thermoplasmata archaeon]